jgi:general secretion pathway protein E
MRYPLPYAFARGNQLLLEDDGDSCAVARRRAGRRAWSEVLRKYRCARCSSSTRPALAQRISAGLRARRIERRHRGERGAERRRPVAHDAGAAGGGRPAGTSDDAPIIRMLNALLTQAARDGASDIHIEPYERHSSVRFRVDGTLREVVQPNRALHAALISRLKIMAELDIAEKRLPQDGRISLRIGTRAVDVRVSTLPSAHGERAVLRLLDKSEAS